MISSVANNFIADTPTASIAYQIISKHDFTIYERKSSQSKITYIISFKIPKFENF